MGQGESAENSENESQKDDSKQTGNSKTGHENEVQKQTLCEEPKVIYENPAHSQAESKK